MRSPMQSRKNTRSSKSRAGRDMNDLSLFVAGAAGEGIQTIGDIVARAFLHHGYPVFATSEFESRIRGGNSSTRLRIGERPLNAPRPDADVLLALNPAARDHYLETLREGGLLIADETEDDRSVQIPFSDLAIEHGGAKLFANAVAAGSLIASTGLPFGCLEQVLSDAFEARGEDVIQSNVAAARAGYEHAIRLLGARAPGPIPARKARHVFASAHSVIPIAAAAAGCRFIAAYPCPLRPELSRPSHVTTIWASSLSRPRTRSPRSTCPSEQAPQVLVR